MEVNYLEKKNKFKKSVSSKDGEGYQLRIDQEAAMRKFRRRQRSISVKTIDSQKKMDHKIPGTNFPSKSNSPWNKHGNIKRPMNAFMLFGRAYRPIMVQMFPGAPNSQISVYLGNIWRSMTWEQQKPFFEEAKRIRYRHQNDYPECLYERENQRSIKYIKKLREDYMIPKNQVFLPRDDDDMVQTQLCQSIPLCAQKAEIVLSNMEATQEVTDMMPNNGPTGNIIVHGQASNEEIFTEADSQIFPTSSWGHEAAMNNVDFSGYVRTFSPLSDSDYDRSNPEATNVDSTIQFAEEDQTSFDLQDLWNLVEGNSPILQNGNSQDCNEESLSLVKMCDCGVKSPANFHGSLTPLNEQPSLDLQELWNLVENSSPHPSTQILDPQSQQDAEVCSWLDVPCEKVVSVGPPSEMMSPSNMVQVNPVEFTVSPTLWPTAYDAAAQCHVIQKENFMDSLPEHSIQLIVTDTPQTFFSGPGGGSLRLSPTCLVNNKCDSTKKDVFSFFTN